MTSEQKSETQFEKNKNIVEEYIKKYEEKNLGFPNLDQFKLPEHLVRPISELRKKSIEELTESIICLHQYSLFIQKSLNEEKAWKTWALSKIDEVAGEQIQQIGNGYGWSERMLIAKTQHPLCKELNKFLREINMKIDRMYGVPNEIDKIADSINNLRFEKIRQLKNGD